jgi:hypothetical protein
MYVYICMYVYIYGGNFFPIMERGGFPLSHRVLWVFPPISNHGSVQQTCWTAWQNQTGFGGIHSGCLSPGPSWRWWAVKVSLFE